MGVRHCSPTDNLDSAVSSFEVGRRDVDDDSFRDLMAEHIRDWERLVEPLHYMKIDILDGADYERLRARLEELDARRGTEGNYLFYTAIPPGLFSQWPSPSASSTLLTSSRMALDSNEFGGKSEQHQQVVLDHIP